MNEGENEEPREEDLYSVAMEGRVGDIPRVLARTIMERGRIL